MSIHVVKQSRMSRIAEVVVVAIMITLIMAVLVVGVRRMTVKQQQKNSLSLNSI